MKLFAKILYYASHPILMPLMGLYLMININNQMAYYHGFEKLRILLYLLSTILFIILPIFSTFIFYKSNIIHSMDLESKDDRLPSMILFLFYSIAFYYYIKDIEVIQPILFSFFTGIILATIISITLSYFMNLSLHNIGISFVLGMLIALAQQTSENHDAYIYGFLFLMGVISSIQLYLEKVNLFSLLTSAVIGFSCAYLCILFEVSRFIK